MTFFHRPVGLVELLILYARVQFYTPRASDYRLISKTANVTCWGLNWEIFLILILFKQLLSNKIFLVQEKN
jgi:hypothetical protein